MLDQTRLGMDDAARRLSEYFVSQLLVNTAFGIVVGVGLLLIGVPNPVLFGILSALLRFIPYVGSLIGALLPMTMAAAADTGWLLVLWTGLWGPIGLVLSTPLTMCLVVVGQHVRRLRFLDTMRGEGTSGLLATPREDGLGIASAVGRHP